MSEKERCSKCHKDGSIIGKIYVDGEWHNLCKPCFDSDDLKEWIKEKEQRLEEKHWVEFTWTNGKKHRINIKE